ncbi:Por secretion system C-terminal sorting domain-containing protein [Psychroflexus salarius]|uniref:Por secretion system C-terminal sorting domain-containing protein n=1 Tax=Psychroflexus salarius TaxID=1155689 RepID=A0A1M4TUA4_9FLAO|nr:T9SS type A sorting domain-containing protein [Psychroflexus salarius]SHE47974.1 Por secretion system C-terminal sorting domain-containing protein [Psychroflexus salarius]
MKTLIYISLILISGISVAQNEILTEHEWELEYIELNGETFYQPNNEESNTSITLEIGESAIIPGQPDQILQVHNLICGELSCVSVDFTSDNMFTSLGCGFTLEGCSVEENNVFQSNYMMVYENLMGGSELNPFNYTFTTENDIISLTITNSLGDSATYSATTLSNRDYEGNTFSIFPNPVTSKLRIRSQQTIQHIEIFDLNGKQIINVDYQENQAINVSNLNSGLYLVKIKTKNGFVTKKLLKK